MPENWATGLSTTDFQLAVEYELNQNPNKLVSLIDPKNVGQFSDIADQIVDRFGDLVAEPKTGRNMTTNLTDIAVTRRWIKKPIAFNIGVPIERQDTKQTRVGLGAPIVHQVSNAGRRYHGDQFIAGYFGNAYTGVTGAEVAVPFKPANIVPHGGLGFTKAKLLSVLEMMNLNDVDMEMEQPVMLLDAKSKTELFSIPEYINWDYNGNRPLMDGQIKPWLGMNFVEVNLTSKRGFPNGAALVQPGAGQVALPVFVPSGLYRGVWDEAYTSIDVRPDLSLSTQIYGEFCSAVVRLNEDKCYQVVVQH